MGLVVPRSIEKVIYLDCDMIIRRDLTALWEMPLAGHVLAAALDPGYDLGFVPGWPSDTPYFNSGVMLVDLARGGRRELAKPRCASRSTIRTA